MKPDQRGLSLSNLAKKKPWYDLHRIIFHKKTHQGVVNSVMYLFCFFCYHWHLVRGGGKFLRCTQLEIPIITISSSSSARTSIWKRSQQRPGLWKYWNLGTWQPPREGNEAISYQKREGLFFELESRLFPRTWTYNYEGHGLPQRPLLLVSLGIGAKIICFWIFIFI